MNTEAIVDWLLSGLELKSTLFHVGQYCGSWQASTAGNRQASFHVVLHGRCWLHLPSTPWRPAQTLLLNAGDAVFLLRDMPHCLSPHPQPPDAARASARIGAMTPLAQPAVVKPAVVDAAGVELAGVVTAEVGLACGFFEFRSNLDDLLLGLLPDHIVARQADPQIEGARAIFALIRAEALRKTDAPSALVARLTDLLFFYALRAALREEPAPGLWTLMRRPEFATLMNAIIGAPGENWTTDAMARFVHMSRARFCKLFADISGQPPAQFVTLIRMKVAAGMLRTGATTPDAAEHIGYHSESAFAHAFKRVTGVQPGAYRRLRAAQDTGRQPLPLRTSTSEQLQ